MRARRWRSMALGLALALATAALSAQTFPSRPIRIVVPQAPGGQSDVIARATADSLGQIWGEPVVVENRGGVGGTIGGEIVARSDADGYTLLLAGTNNLVVAALLRADLPYRPIDDFVGIGLIARVPYAIAVGSRLPVRSVPELVAYARAHPGKLTYGSSGTGSMSELAVELLKAAEGLDILEVPYKGSAPAVMALVRGEIDLMVTDLALLTAHARSGAIRLVAAAGRRRAIAAPDLATVAEQGVAGYAVEPWYGLVAPVRTSTQTVAQLREGLRRSLQSPELKRRLDAVGYEPVEPAIGDLETELKSDLARYRALVQRLGLAVGAEAK